MTRKLVAVKKQSISGCPAIAAVIKKLGGAQKVAEIVGLKQSSIYMWGFNGAVPPKRARLLKAYADENNIPLFYNEFYRLPISAEDIKKLVRSYYDKLENDTLLTPVKGGEAYGIQLPWPDNHGDYLHIYVEKTDEGYLLSDDGDTYDHHAQMSQIPQKHIDYITADTSVDITQVGDKCILSIKTTQENFGRDMNAMLQCLLDISHFNS